MSAVESQAQRNAASAAEIDAHEFDMPEELSERRVRGRLLIVAGLVLTAVAIVTLLPGLASLRTRFAHAQLGWLGVGIALKFLSGLAYVVVFRAVFCNRMTWRHSYQVGMSELGANALFPTAGAGGLALGAWALRRGGMSAAHIARRTVAFFLITSAANVGALVLVGAGIASGILPGKPGLALTLIPAVVALMAIAATIAIGRLAGRLRPRFGETSRRAHVLAAIASGVDEALVMLRQHDWQLVAGAIGYLAFDVMILWATFHAFGSSPALSLIWIAYLIGELGGLLPIPGGIGGVDAGLVGTLVVYGVAVTPATAAVLAYRAIALWVPAVVGGAAFVALRRTLRTEPDDLAPCAPAIETLAV